MRGVTAFALCAVGAAAAAGAVQAAPEIPASAVGVNVVDDFVASHPEVADIFSDQESFNEAIADFEQGGEHDDGSVVAQFLTLLQNEAAAADESEKNGRNLRQLAEENNLDAHSRQLAQGPGVLRAIELMFHAGGYPSYMSASAGSAFGGRDQVKVIGESGVCYVIAQESNDAGDWWLNAQSLFKSRIKSAVRTERYCKKRNWWGSCRSYGNRAADIGNTEVGRGFASAYDDMRYRVKDLMSVRCSGVGSTVYAGYSRGGAIATTFALAHNQDGLTRGRKELITLGSPRTLSDGNANHLQGQFQRTVRVRYGGDCVTGIPFAWMGFKHVGAERYNLDGHGMGQNDDFFNAFKCGDHAGYANWYKRHGYDVVESSK